MEEDEGADSRNPKGKGENRSSEVREASWVPACLTPLFQGPGGLEAVRSQEAGDGGRWDTLVP